MSEAKIAAKSPAVQSLQPGTYYWCRCGHSKNQPLCDGAHQGTGFEPMAFEITSPEPVALCQCKRTKNPPFCDGSHSTL